MQQKTACSISAPLILKYAPIMGEREPLNQLPPGKSLFLAGWLQVFDTARELRKSFPMLFRYLIALMFLDGANFSILSLLVLYAKDQLKIQNTSILVAIAGIAAIPGAWLTSIIVKKFGAIRALFFVISISSVNLIIAVFFIYKPSQAWLTSIMCFGFGVAIGGTYLAQKVYYLMIIPYGQEAELQGFYCFCSAVLQFIPPAIASILESVFDTARWGLIGILLFLIIAGCILASIDNDSARRAVEATNDKKADAIRKAKAQRLRIRHNKVDVLDSKSAGNNTEKDTETPAHDLHQG